jgi:hypothetical protein
MEFSARELDHHFRTQLQLKIPNMTRENSFKNRVELNQVAYKMPLFINGNQRRRANYAARGLVC